MDSYKEIKQWKQENMANYIIDFSRLNQFHDEVMKKVFNVAVSMVGESPPCPFSWFVTGSGGRFEQGLVSDQDHGIIYMEHSDKSIAYFKRLGRELADGLQAVGYPYCEGHVMSSNPLWCKSSSAWETQLIGWMEERSWSSIRNLQIFYDARTVTGENQLLISLKGVVHNYCGVHPRVLFRFYENMKHLKQVIGPLGQLLVEEKGIYKGMIDLKYGAFIPYVNSVRLLALKEGIFQTSTLERFEKLIRDTPYSNELLPFAKQFSALLKLRFAQSKVLSSYVESHYLPIKELTKQEKKELKSILKDAKRLHQLVQRILERDESYGI